MDRDRSRREVGHSEDLPWSLTNSPTGAEALNWVNAANARMALVQFHIADGRIWGYHWISYIDGLNIRQLINTLRRFSTGFKEGVLIEPDHA